MSSTTDLTAYGCCCGLPPVTADLSVAQYGRVLDGFEGHVAALFAKLDLNGSGYLEKTELKKVVERYNGEQFDEAEFMNWFDIHGSRGSRPDGKLDLKEFGWYLADVAKSFGGSDAETRKVLPTALAHFEKVAQQLAEERQYDEIVNGFSAPVGALFTALDQDCSNFLEKRELKRIVECYTGDTFNESEFFRWFDVHGDKEDSSGPDGKLDLKEFGWYLADVAKSFGESTEEARSALPAVISGFTFASFVFG